MSRRAGRRNDHRYKPRKYSKARGPVTVDTTSSQTSWSKGGARHWKAVHGGPRREEWS